MVKSVVINFGKTTGRNEKDSLFKVSDFQNEYDYARSKDYTISKLSKGFVDLGK